LDASIQISSDASPSGSRSIFKFRKARRIFNSLPASAQDLRSIREIEQQLHSAFHRFIGKQPILRGGTFSARAQPAIGRRHDVSSADETK